MKLLGDSIQSQNHPFCTYQKGLSQLEQLLSSCSTASRSVTKATEEVFAKLSEAARRELDSNPLCCNELNDREFETLTKKILHQQHDGIASLIERVFSRRVVPRPPKSVTLAAKKLYFQTFQSGGAFDFGKRFAKESSAVRLELAKLYAKYSGSETLLCIEDFKVEDQAGMLEVAKLCAQQDARQTVASIKDFGITDQALLLEFAKYCAQQDPWSVLLNVHAFGVPDQAGRLELAKLCAEIDGVGTELYIRSFCIEDQAGRLEVARLCAQHSDSELAVNLRNFGIEDQAGLLELAKLFAQKNGSQTAANVNNFGIEGQDNLVELAKVCAEQAPWSIPSTINNFGITSPDRIQEVLVHAAKFSAQFNPKKTLASIRDFGIDSGNQVALVEIAKTCAQKDGAATAYSIKNFGIVGQADRFEVAKLCAQENGGATAMCISNFGIQAQELFRELAKICVQNTDSGMQEIIRTLGIEDIEDAEERVTLARLSAQQDGRGTAGCIGQFRIDDAEERVALAKVCAQQDGGATARYMQDFGIDNAEERIVIARLCARQNGGATARFIRNYGIDSAKERAAIAKLCAQQKGGETACYIGQFEIEDQEELVEIAKLCVQQDASESAGCIADFGVKEETDRIAIAKLSAQQNGRVTAKYISRFKIEDRNALIEIAKLCAQRNGESIPRLIENFGIEDQGALIEIAKLCAQQSGAETAQHIRKFGIENQETLIELAKLCSLQNGKRTPWYIKDFGIQDQGALVEIAKLCTRQGVRDTARCIHEFGLQSQESLAEVARFCAQLDGGATAASIWKFGIVDENALIEIAMRCARQDGGNTAENFMNFGIHNPLAVIEIARLCAQHDGKNTVDKISKFGIQNQEVLIELAKLCAQQDARNALLFIKRTGIEDCLQLNLLHGQCIVYDPELLGSRPRDLTNVYEYFSWFAHILEERTISYEMVNDVIQSMDFMTEERASLSLQLSKIMNNRSEEVRTVNLKWFIATLAATYLLDKESRSYLLSSKLWPELCDLRAPTLRKLLTAQLLELSSDPEKREFWSQQMPASSGGVKRVHLLALPLSSLQREEIGTRTLITAFNTFTQSKLGKDKVFAADLLSTFHQFAAPTLLSNEQKSAVFELLFLSDNGKKPGHSTLKKRIKALRGLMQIMAQGWADSKRDLVELFQEELPRVIPTGDYRGDFLEAYDKHFLKSRHADGLLTYAAGIKSLGDERANQSLGRFVQAVLEERFKEMRYGQEVNPHLQMVFQGRLELEAKWKEGMKFTLEELVSVEGAQRAQDWEKWIVTKLLDDSHLHEMPLRELREYLDGSEVKRSAILQGVEAKLDPKGKGPAQKLDAECECLHLQHACMKLIEAKDSASLAQFQALLQWTPEGTEFARDLHGVISALSEKPVKPTFLSVEVTDDPLDLLYSGTDITGSCQRLNGDAQLNRGLLGTLEDGKVQMIAIKDSQGRIVARRLLKLMWDGKKPVLYQERTYPDVVPLEQQRALDMIANLRAEQLGVALTAAVGHAPYPQPLCSLGGPSPYEYSDASKGIQANGYYSHQAQLVSFEG